ncbi:MAG: hypothetical protein IJY14_01100 [Acholeplasmatales bacterium]|nr:hypothetical protein [Acholeplasmatales bacterium]
MKKIIYLFLMVLLLVSCDTNTTSSNENNSNPSVSITPSEIPSVIPSQTPTPSITITETPTPTIEDKIQISYIEGYNEIISLTFLDINAFRYNIYYKKNNDEYQKLDTNLIFKENGLVTCEIPGLSSGSYSIKIEAIIKSNTYVKEVNNILVSSLDRSGYAHFNNSDGIGAYKNDGTLKDDTIILYLTNENKNTLTQTFQGVKYTGIVNILNNLNKSNKPVLIRVIGKITTNQWNYKEVIPRLTDNSNLDSNHFENTFSNEYGENIENLSLYIYDKKDGISYQYKTTKDGITKIKESTTSKETVIYNRNTYPDLKGKEVYHDDMSFNKASVKNANNVTIEGIGNDAEFFQWGISFSNSNSIEVRNLTFTDYCEDALGFNGDSIQCGGYWIHNNVFNRGKNNWDLTGEQDKYGGDGALDFNSIKNATASYNVFDGCNKTGLVGSSEEASCQNITYHHNYYNNISSRLPLARHANIHIYNNYYKNSNSCLQINSNAYVFSENNLFENCTTPHSVKNDSTYTGTAIKSYNDIFVGGGTIQSTKGLEREEYVYNECKPDYLTDYSTFDIDDELFYYDTINKKSNVSILNNTLSVPDYVVKFAGITGKYNRLPLSNDIASNNQILSNIKEYDLGLSLDLTDIKESVTVSENEKLIAGDVILHYGIEVVIGSNSFLKTLGDSRFNDNYGLIEINTDLDDYNLTVIFSSRNSTAYDRYLIILDENGKEIARSIPTEGSTKLTFNLELEPNTKYYITTINGLNIYNIYIK